MSKEIRVESVKLKIGDTLLDLSLEDARALRDALDKALPQPVADNKVVERYIPYRPYPYWWHGVYGGTVLCSGDAVGVPNTAANPIKYEAVWTARDNNVALLAACQ